jgi:hypothetical protein
VASGDFRSCLTPFSDRLSGAATPRTPPLPPGSGPCLIQRRVDVTNAVQEAEPRPTPPARLGPRLCTTTRSLLVEMGSLGLFFLISSSRVAGVAGWDFLILDKESLEKNQHE